MKVSIQLPINQIKNSQYWLEKKKSKSTDGFCCLSGGTTVKLKGRDKPAHLFCLRGGNFFNRKRDRM